MPATCALTRPKGSEPTDPRAPVWAGEAVPGTQSVVEVPPDHHTQKRMLQVRAPGPRLG